MNINYLNDMRYNMKLCPRYYMYDIAQDLCTEYDETIRDRTSDMFNPCAQRNIINVPNSYSLKNIFNCSRGELSLGKCDSCCPD